MTGPAGDDELDPAAISDASTSACETLVATLTLTHQIRLTSTTAAATDVIELLSTLTPEQLRMTLVGACSVIVQLLDSHVVDSDDELAEWIRAYALNVAAGERLL